MSLKIVIKKILSYFLSKKYGLFGVNSKIQKPFCLIRNKKYIFIGNHVYIRKYSRIEPIDFYAGIKYSPKVIIEDNVNIEQNLHLTCASRVRIGANTSISSNVLVTDIDHGYFDIKERILKQKLIVNETSIGENCLIGSGVKIMAGCKIGNHCIIGANAVVTHDISDYSIAVGIPAKVIKKYNKLNDEWETVK